MQSCAEQEVQLCAMQVQLYTINKPGSNYKVKDSPDLLGPSYA